MPKIKFDNDVKQGIQDVKRTRRRGYPWKRCALKARNPGGQADTPEGIPMEKVCFKGNDVDTPDGGQARFQEPNTKF
uniref:Uncharacterized protein n=1 Tax=Helianthus annuus TaxID=4232 RepID=A0A251TJ80_HELAN